MVVWLDLRWGFHQIELHEDSWDITTFITHEGLFRYKRLSFGVNAAPEKYQHVIRQAVAGTEGDYRLITTECVVSYQGTRLLMHCPCNKHPSITGVHSRRRLHTGNHSTSDTSGLEN